MSSSAGRAKRDREKAKQEKAAVKRERRLGTTDPAGLDDSSGTAASTGPRRTQNEILEELQILHKRFEDGGLDFDEFEVVKNELIGQLDVG